MTAASRSRRVAGLAAAAAILALPAPAQAFKPRTQIYLANLATASLVQFARDTVEIDGREYPVPAAVRNSIRRYPQYFRGGVIGAYGFPDVPGGWGNVQRDTRTANGTSADRGAGGGRSFSWEWLDHVHRSGWEAFNACAGCEKGQQALAFTYGFLVNAAGDVWGHTVANEAAGGPFPVLSTSNLILRHLIVEEYVARHTPATTLTMDAPATFIYKTFIDDPVAAGLGRGSFIDPMARLRTRLDAKRDDLRGQVHDLTHKCLVSAGGRCIQRGTRPQDIPKVVLLRLEVEMIPPWIAGIDALLRNYPTFSRELARGLFTRDIRTFVDDALTAIQTMIVKKGLEIVLEPFKLGIFAGVAADLLVKLDRFAVSQLEAVLPPGLRDKNTRTVLASLLSTVFGGRLPLDVIPVLADPALYVNRSSLGFASDTSAKLDRLMGLARDGVQNPSEPFDPERFAAARNAVTLAKLTLLDGDGLNQVLADHGVPPRYARGDNVMLGWTRSLAGDHQWRERSTRDGRRYGEGTFPLWADCAARTRIFRPLFRDWEHGADNFPDLGDFPAGCHGWTSVNDDAGRYAVTFGAAPDGADAVTFRLRLRGLDGTGIPLARGAQRRPTVATVADVYARRHLETAAETVSFTFETGGQTRLGVGVYGDGRLLRTLRAPGPVVLESVGAREITFKLVGSALPGAVVGGSGTSASWFARVSHLRTTAAGWETALSADAAGVDTGALAQAGGAASAAFVADSGIALRGSALAVRRSADPVDSLSFRYEPGQDGALLGLSVEADGRAVRTLSGGAQDVTLTGLNAREIAFRWRALSAPALSAAMGARVTNVRTTTATGTPPTPTKPPAPPPPPPVSRSGVDVRAPGVRVLRVRVVRRGRSRTLVATFRLTERARVLLRV
ncbi:MAG: hypothetical protein QOI91_278, partial [Solirubrobacteraceae bacterium]|nr:hypothetical protein [Solirubrobacteraceae bacterium]